MIKNKHKSDWLPALMPAYAGGNSVANISPEAWDFFRADYLRLERPAASAVYRRLQRAAEKHGWNVPSINTFVRKIEQLPQAIVVLKREGITACERMILPAQERHKNEQFAGQWINGDGYQHNVFIKHPDFKDPIRMKTWFFQDIYSGMMTAWRTDVSENSDVIRLAFGDHIEQYGIPEKCTLDNTRAAANKWMTGRSVWRQRFKIKDDEPLGVFGIVGTEVRWTKVAHGQSKPIERAFGIGGIGEVVDKHPAFAGAWCGNNPTAKPENYGTRAVPLDLFLKTLEQEVIAWNQAIGRRSKMCAGRSYEETFNDSYKTANIRIATESQRRSWMMMADAMSTQRVDGSIKMAGNRYWTERLSDFSGSRRQKVVVRFDPQNLHDSVHVYRLDGSYICEAECVEATGWADKTQAREHNRARTQLMKATKLAAKAEIRMSTLEAANAIPELDAPSAPDSKVVTPVFNKKPAEERDEASNTNFSPATILSLEAMLEKQSKAI